LRIRRNEVDTSIRKYEGKAALNEVVPRVFAENVSCLAQTDFFHISKRNRGHTYRNVLHLCAVTPKRCNVNATGRILTTLAPPLQTGAVLRDEKGAQLSLAVTTVPAVAWLKR
jgi:hypothetical protein